APRDASSASRTSCTLICSKPLVWIRRWATSTKASRRIVWASGFLVRAIATNNRPTVGLLLARQPAVTLPHMPYVDPAHLPAREPLAGWRGRFFHSDHMTFAYYEIDADAVPIHEHRHPQEEVWNVVAGRLAITIAGEERVVGAGCAAVVPA